MALAEAHLGIKKLLGVQVWGEDTEFCAWVTAQHLCELGTWHRVSHRHLGGSLAPAALGVFSLQLHLQRHPRGQGWCLLSAKG